MKENNKGDRSFFSEKIGSGKFYRDMYTSAPEPYADPLGRIRYGRDFFKIINGRGQNILLTIFFRDKIPCFLYRGSSQITACENVPVSGSDWPGGPPGTDRCAPTKIFAPLLSLYCAPADKTTFTLRWLYISIGHQTKPQAPLI